MIIYESLKNEFLEDVVDDKIAEKVESKYFELTNKYVSQAEKRAWNNSMEYMYKVLNNENISNGSGIAIEFKIPYISRRVDFIIKFIKYGDKREAILMIDKGKIKPSKSLQDSLSKMLKGNDEFVMIDSQKVVYETVLQMAKN